MDGHPKSEWRLAQISSYLNDIKDLLTKIYEHPGGKKLDTDGNFCRIVSIR